MLLLLPGAEVLLHMAHQAPQQRVEGGHHTVGSLRHNVLIARLLLARMLVLLKRNVLQQRRVLLLQLLAEQVHHLLQHPPLHPQLPAEAHLHLARQYRHARPIPHLQRRVLFRSPSLSTLPTPPAALVCLMRCKQNG